MVTASTSPNGDAPSGNASARRLVAVAVIDVVGYSRLMDLDETETHARWMEMCNRVILPSVQQRGGRIIKSTGDGFLITFDSVVDAVRWGLGLQAAATAPENAPFLPVRVAVHLADAITERDDIYGSGVNAVARLQEYAEPGAVLISSTVHELVRSVLAYEAQSLGPLQLKNIRDPVVAFSIAPSGGEPRPRAIARAEPPPAGQPSIAVMPLRTIGAERVDSYLTEGIAHDVAGTLADLKELFVVSSSSTVALAQTSPDIAAVGQRLGVRYLLSGTIARVAAKLRILVELADIETRRIIWGARYEITDSELFTTQDVIASRIAHSLVPHLRQFELTRLRRKRPDEMGAYDLVLQGLYKFYRLEEQEWETAKDLFEGAIAKDPRYAMAYSLLAAWYMMRVGQGSSTDVEADSREALRLASTALEHDSADPLALAVYGHTLSFLFSDFDRAMDAFDRAIASSPNSALAWGFSSPTYSYIGECETAVSRAEYGLRLSPLDPYAYWLQTALTLAHHFNGTHEDAVRWGRKTMAANPRFTANMRPLIGSLVALGRTAEAHEIARQMVALEPQFSVNAFMARYPLRDPAARALYAERLIAAGLRP
jgi:class 3 adenylate cyclase/TolB-like protein